MRAKSMFVALIAAVLVLLTAPVAPAHATAGDLLCTPPSSQTTTATPPLTQTPQPVTLASTTNLGPCVSTARPDIVSGTRTSGGPAGNMSCLDLLGSFNRTSTITWNTGETSTINVNVQTTQAGVVTTYVSTGTVISGLFAGDTVAINGTGVDPNLPLCILGLASVSSTYYTMTLTFL